MISTAIASSQVQPEPQVSPPEPKPPTLSPVQQKSSNSINSTNATKSDKAKAIDPTAFTAQIEALIEAGSTEAAFRASLQMAERAGSSLQQKITGHRMACRALAVFGNLNAISGSELAGHRCSGLAPSQWGAPFFAETALAQSIQDMMRAGAASMQAAIGLMEEETQGTQGTQPSAAMYTEFACCLWLCGERNGAFVALMHGLVAYPNDQSLQRMLAALSTLAAPDYSALQSVVAPMGQSSGAALAYLALKLKDHGDLRGAEHMLSQALVQDPLNPAYLLNWMHVKECLAEDKEAVQAAWQWCLRHRNDLMLVTDDGRRGKESLSCLVDPMEQRLLRQGSENGSGSVTPLVSIPAVAKLQLDVLAILFTCAKIWWMLGEGERAAAIVAVCDGLREGRDLHMTSIRNEHAYFLVLRDLLQTSGGEVSSSGGRSTSLPSSGIYVVGDSHVVPLVGRVLDDGTPFVASVVTGVKIWHLRPASDFYPKAQFFQRLSAIPRGATVLLIMGEIDCREGVLRAVESGKYPSLPAAFQALLDIYEALIQTVRDRFGLNVLVHPAPSVLKETRRLVAMFNSGLQARFQAFSPSEPFPWALLDIADALLQDDGSLKQEYSLDGTHLNPCYVSLLSDAWRKISGSPQWKKQ